MKKKTIIFILLGIIVFLLVCILLIFKNPFSNKNGKVFDKFEDFTYVIPSNLYSALSDANGSTWYKDRENPYCAITINYYDKVFVYNSKNPSSAYDPRNIIDENLKGISSNLKYNYSDIKEIMIDGHKWYYIDNAYDTVNDNLVQFYLGLTDYDEVEHNVTYYSIKMSAYGGDKTKCTETVKSVINSIKYKK